MKLFNLLMPVALLMGSYPLNAQDCLDAAQEPHHHVVFENGSLRVLTLDLGRIESTTPYCYAAPFTRIITTESKTSNTNDGAAGSTREWRMGEGRFVYASSKARVVHNERAAPHHEIIIETRRTVVADQINAPSNADVDLFGGNPGDTKPTWTITAMAGGLVVSETQLASGDRITLKTPGHVLIAITPIELRSENPGQRISMGAGEVQVLKEGKVRDLLNSGTSPARFALVEF